MRFSGSFCALVTPMKADLSLDWAALEGLVEWHVESGTRGLVIAGTTGESASLDLAEYAELIDRSVACSKGRIPIVAGAGSASTRAGIALARVARERGAEALLVVTPYYYRPTQDGLIHHYRALAQAVDLPILMYNVPGRTGVDLLPDTVAQLAGVTGIVGLKEAVPDTNRISELLSKAPELVLLSGDDDSALRSMELGAHGVISVVANVAPAEMAQLCQYCAEGDLERARQLDSRLRPLYQSLFVEPNPTPVKWALARMNRVENAIRPPLLPLSAAARGPVARDLAAVIDQTGPSAPAE